MLLNWIKAFRLRTLPLSFSTIIMGNAIALLDHKFSLNIFIATVLTTLFLQILSNLANDYGDGIKGTDNEDRLGPARALQSGAISIRQMKIGIAIFALLALMSGLYLVIYTVTFDGYLQILFIVLGIAAIAAAIKYTVGKTAYGYHGLGDVFVFIFFGLIGVIGSYYLQTQSFNLLIILPAISIGCLSTAVLNLNNMRDVENDAKMNKNTIVVKLGLKKAKAYHYSLFGLTYLTLFAFIFTLPNENLMNGLLILTLLILAFHGKHVRTIQSASSYESFDPELKKIALSTLLLSLFWVGAIIYL